MRTSLLLSILVAIPCAGQTRSFAIDARPVGGMLSLAWRAAEGRYIGIGLGGGTDELGQTLRPSRRDGYHDFEQFMHLDVFLRLKPTGRVDLDLGVRGGLGDVRVCDASDCLPGAFAGAYAALFVGSARWKVGTRVIGARVWESAFRDDVVHWEVISLRYSR